MPHDYPPMRRHRLIGRRVPRRVLAALLSLCLAATALFAQSWRDPAPLQRQLAARFGPARVPLLDEWLSMIASAGALQEEARLERVNDFINRRIAFENDLAIWQQSDYWATPLETIGQGRGDCEDFAIIKYVSLRMARVASGKLRLIYAKARIDAPAGPIVQAHMVLAYYATPDAEPLVLDNLDGTIRPASRRPDLQPVFSFNSDGIFAGVSGRNAVATGGIGRLSRWENAWRRILADGYE